MGIRCFLCGDVVDDKEDKLFITTECGNIANIIHRECYDYDYRTHLDRKEIFRRILADST